MKFICYIFSFYVLLLSVVPCVDAVGASVSNEHLTLQSSQDNGQSNKEDNDCSPFCTCACCGCNAFNVPCFYTVVSCSEFVSENFICNYSVCFSSDFISSIWQPPKYS